jgi:hypothetical protein
VRMKSRNTPRLAEAGSTEMNNLGHGLMVVFGLRPPPWRARRLCNKVWNATTVVVSTRSACGSG